VKSKISLEGTQISIALENHGILGTWTHKNEKRMMATLTNSVALKPLAAKARAPRRTRAARAVSRKVSTMEVQEGYSWIEKNPIVPAAGFLGWVVPSSIPAIKGTSLTAMFLGSISEQMARFPEGPGAAGDDGSFYFLMVIWHMGLFLTMTLGQIGVQGRSQGMFK